MKSVILALFSIAVFSSAAVGSPSRHLNGKTILDILQQSKESTVHSVDIEQLRSALSGAMGSLIIFDLEESKWRVYNLLTNYPDLAIEALDRGTNVGRDILYSWMEVSHSLNPEDDLEESALLIYNFLVRSYVRIVKEGKSFEDIVAKAAPEHLSALKNIHKEALDIMVNKVEPVMVMLREILPLI